MDPIAPITNILFVIAFQDLHTFTPTADRYFAPLLDLDELLIADVEAIVVIDSCLAVIADPKIVIVLNVAFEIFLGMNVDQLLPLLVVEVQLVILLVAP